jgi:hypothetical protein
MGSTFEMMHSEINEIKKRGKKICKEKATGQRLRQYPTLSDSNLPVATGASTIHNAVLLLI